MEQKDKNQFEEAYKMVSGDPAIDAVSKAAKGEMPMTDNQSRMKEHTKQFGCADIEEAYAMLFEGLAIIARSHAVDKPE